MKVKLEIVYKGDKLQAVRKTRGLSQSQLAERTGISLRMIQHYEQGKNDLNSARLSTILKLCAALECKMNDILNDPETIELLKQYGE